MKKVFEILYKQTSGGKVQQWQISVSGSSVTTEYGLTDGKKQKTMDILKEGLNLGRSNATTPETQALAQAQSAYEAKLKEGYVLDQKVAASTKNTLGAVEPMLAHPIEKKEKYAVFPGLAQPKLDGARCIAIVQDGKARLFSRTQKEWLTMPHIVSELETLFGDKDIVLDGELYNRDYHDDFNKIISIIKRDDVHPDHELVQYHVYDVVSSEPFVDRIKVLDYFLPQAKYLKEVQTVSVRSREELDQYQATCIENGYEGCMFRSKTGRYEHKRSTNLLKVKTFQDSEYKVVGVEEGSGKLMNHVGAFILQLPLGPTFRASPLGSHEILAEYWVNRESLIGKWATVKYQALTPDGVPRFPKLKCIRDYE